MKSPRILGTLLLLAAAILPARAESAAAYANRPDDFYKTEKARQIADNLLTWQGLGPDKVMGWTKNYDADMAYKGDGKKDLKGTPIDWAGIATIDNGSTHSELLVLARCINAEPDVNNPRRAKWLASFNAGLDAVIEHQYPNGGWPQRFPATAKGQAAYAPRITFNDNAIGLLLKQIKAISEGAGPYGFVDEKRRAAAKTSFEKGLDCILNCQVTINGQLTAWCAQHDEKTLKPADGRAFELASLSGGESADIVLFLMSLDHPSPRVKTAVEAAVAWYEAAKIKDKAFRTVNGPNGPDRLPVDAPGQNLWARFYDLDTMKPIFANRDLVKHFDILEITPEGRRGYAWYGTWGEKVAAEYKKWKPKNP